MPPRNFAVKLGQDEISRIIGLKEDLDYWEVLEEAARGYCLLGWSLVAVDDQENDLGINFRQPPEEWSEALAELAWREAPANLAVRTGKASQLLVLDVRPGELPQEDNQAWKADIVALGPQGWERHFYGLAGTGPIIPAGAQTRGLRLHGEDGLVLVPPSRKSEGGAWRWLVSPRGKPPRQPGPKIWKFFRERNLIPSLPDFSDSWDPPSWEEIYRHISDHPRVLQALLAPEATAEAYYQGVAHTAWAAGLRDPRLLLGLLYHAPLGDVSRCPERWDFLQHLVNDPPRSPAGPSASDFRLCRLTERAPEVWNRFFQIMSELGAQFTRDKDEALAKAWGHSAAGGPSYPPAGPGLSHPDITRAPAQLCHLDAANLADGLAPCQQELIRFFLKNYIIINPEWAGLPLNQQLALAQQMAQDFLSH
jgi:hypothetical protein